MIDATYGPLKGMPEVLPDGEVLLWQGRPSCWSLARRALHIRKIAAYFAVLVIWRVASGMSDGFSLSGSSKNTLILIGLSVTAVCIVALLAFAYSRTTVYSITNRRVVMHIGIALPVALNLPFAAIGAASARIHSDGTGDIPLTLVGDGRIAYLHLWPHARPWLLKHPEPMLRCVADGEKVAAILGRALRAAQREHAGAVYAGEKQDQLMPGQLAPAAA